MKKQLLSILIVLALTVSLIPAQAFAASRIPDGTQTNYGSFVSGAKVISDMIGKHGENAHPRIIMTNDKFARLRSHKNDGSTTAVLLEKLKQEADSKLGAEVLKYEIPDGIRLLETSKRIQRRVAVLALAYNIYDNDEYALQAYKELKNAANFPDWNPNHFLDTAEMCTAFAIGYDWLYGWLSQDQRDFLRKALIEKGLKQVMEDYKDAEGRERTYKWYQDRKGDNWKLVCTGSTNMAALAIGDENNAKDIASQVLDYGYKEAYSFVRRAYSSIDGTYIEGLGYWDYATYYLGLNSSALKSATGTDYGLADHEGLRKSVDFVRYMSSNTPLSFSFGDDRDSRDTGWSVFLWLGEHYNSYDIASVRLKKIASDSFNYLDALWIDEDNITGSQIQSPVDWGSVGASNASFRDTWDKTGLVTALHSGVNNYLYHGHYDLGSFYLESNGSRFFTDLGNEDYELEGRQYSYRIRAEGHNTLVINPSKELDQKEGAECYITKYKAGNEAYAATDLTDAYKPSGAKSVVRTLKMIKDKKCVIVQDDISLNKAGEIYWFAHTKGQIKLASDGRSAIVTVGEDRLWVGLLSGEGNFSVMKAELLPTSRAVAGQTDSSEYRKLAIHLTDTKDTTIQVVCIPLKKGETKPSWTPKGKVSIELNKTGDAIVCGKTGTLKATVRGTFSDVSWKSSDPKIASVDANGKVTAKMAGKVKITASVDGKSASCTLTVLYKDVTDSKDFWYVPTNYLTNAGVVKGYDDQTMFKPANKCSRAQMVTFIWRLKGEPEPKAKTCKFPDVKKTDYFYKACIWANENHIVEGYKNGTFGPQITCARKHAVTFLWRLAGKPETKSAKKKFDDVKTNAYYYKATLWASEKGILAGYSDGTFKPDGDCLRRQMVTFLYKYGKKVK